ncbi:type III-B CRISPR module RAMP protein Cmr6 [Stygiolobus caldivivus]|uniref:CRISPR type III-associated protein domain-containing protein n=1 Tax=Stygiolobus caldivivus TaxID=2824673 RepID=A0A8D5U461_9CREN|nr:type III-B CRISPR module RAMP protein Cmr6 [Stygiolobus caldivivus]BCU68783.1 hypothetical protein KN1_00800 [Stygiolobus caldivivus]
MPDGCSLICLLQDYVGMLLNDLKNKDEIKRKMVKTLTSCSFSQNMEIANKSLDEGVNALRSTGYCALDITARTAKKFYVGVSELSPFYLFFETGLVWDLALNLPYIPGSVIKGVLRSYMTDLCNKNEECISYVYEIFGVPEKDIHRGENVEIYVTGLDASSSLLVVLDSYPIKGERLLTGDITTPHYFKRGGAVKNEYEVSPKPSLRVAINEGVTFRFVVGIHQDALPLFQEWASYLGYKSGGMSFLLPLFYAFKQGIGAKTSRGYGEFELEDFSLVSFNFIKPKKVGRVRVSGR